MYITNDINSDATITTIVLSCKSDHVGQVTLFTNSSVDSCMYSFNLFMFILTFARAPGLEPRSAVLETDMLPLHHARVLDTKCWQVAQPTFSIYL